MATEVYAETLNEKLDRQVPYLTKNDGAKNLTAGSWYVVSRYNVEAKNYTVLTAMLSTSGRLYDVVLTKEAADGSVEVTRPTTYKQIVDSLKN